LKGSKIPSVLKISIFNASTKRSGNLFLFDLLEPKFVELSSNATTAGGATTNGIENCFDNLRKSMQSAYAMTFTDLITLQDF